MATATAAKPKLVNLTERSAVSGRVDRENHRIYGVKLLGVTSKNGRRYAEQAMERAVPLYEGADVCINHPKGRPQSPRDYQERLAVVENVVFRRGEGLFGDLNYNPKHLLAEQVLWDAENNSKNIGLSHNVSARVVRERGGELVEEIASVASVDLVAGPATTKSLFESQSRDAMTIRQLLEKCEADPRTKRLIEMLDSPMLDSAVEADGEGGDVDELIHQAFAAAEHAVVDSDLPPAEKKDKLDQLLDLEAGATEGNGGDGDGGGEEESATEQKKNGKASAAQIAVLEKMQRQIEQQGRRLLATEVLTEAGVAIKGELVDELAAKADRKAMKSLVESWSPAKRGEKKPAIATRLFEQSSNIGSYPSDHKDFVRTLKRR